MSTFWQDLTEVLQKNALTRGGPVETSDKTEGLSLFRAVRTAAGIDKNGMDLADVSFWNWIELRTQFSKIWEALDLVVSEIANKPQKAVSWLHFQEQENIDLLKVINQAAINVPNIPSLRAHRRPEAHLMVNIGKVDAAIFNTIAVIVKQTETSYTEILASQLENELSDEDLLRRLDEFVDNNRFNKNEIDNASWIPRELLRAKQVIRDSTDEIVLPVVTFLRILDTSNNITSITDETLLRRLLLIAPESAEISRRMNKTGVETT